MSLKSDLRRIIRERYLRVTHMNLQDDVVNDITKEIYDDILTKLGIER